jgi:hypothetical protein
MHRKYILSNKNNSLQSPQIIVADHLPVFEGKLGDDFPFI